MYRCSCAAMIGWFSLLLLCLGCPAPSQDGWMATPGAADLAAADLQADGGLGLSAVAPALGPTAGGIPVQVDGAGFLPGASVQFAGVMATEVRVISPTRLIAVLPKQLGLWGKVAVTVTNPDGSSTSRADLFGYYASQLSFPRAIAEVRLGPTSVATGDFNGDQTPDLVVASEYSGNIALVLGDATGSLSAATYFNVGSAIAVAVADFNGDQNADVAVADYLTNVVDLLLGDGLGGFRPVLSYPVGTRPAFLAVGDFNLDKAPDLAVANSNSNDVSILLGDGKGGFAPAKRLAVGSDPLALAVADFNGDQKPDLAVANSLGNNVSIALGDGKGGFGPLKNFAAGTSPQSVAVGDFNDDLVPTSRRHRRSCHESQVRLPS